MDSLASLVAPIPLDRFLADYYGKQPLHIRAESDARRSVLTWDQLNAMLSMSSIWTEPRLKLFIEGGRIAPEHYCDTIQTLDGETRRVNPRKVQVFLSMGASLVANAVEALSPELRETARGLERDLLGLTSANIYCSFGGRRAFNSHFDTHEVFAIHTEGEKVWRIYEGRADNPLTAPPDHPDIQQQLDRQKGRLLQEVVMRPGDVLYIPRGQFHDALASSQASLHVTFSVEPRNGRGLLRLLEQEVLSDSLFRDYLPHPAQDRGAALDARLEALGDRLRAMIVSPAFREEVVGWQQSIFGDLSEFSLPSVGPLEAFEVRPRRAEIVQGPAGWMLRTDAGLIPLEGLRKPVAWLLGRPAFTVQELCAWFPQSGEAALRAMLERLSRVGLIARRS